MGLYIMHSDGSRRRRIAADINAAWPRWSPDGTKLAFVDEDDGSIHVLDVAHGGGERKVVDVTRLHVDVESNFTKPAWSPDGTKLVFAAGGPHSSHLYEVDLFGGGLVGQLTKGAVTDESPDWSPTACP